MANQQKDQRKTSSTGPIPESMNAPAAGSGNIEQNATSGSGQSETFGSNAQSGDTGSSSTDLYNQAKEAASGSLSAVTKTANSTMEQHKHEISSDLKTIASGIRHMGNQIGSSGETNQLANLTSQYTDTAAGAIDQVANYFDRKDFKAMLRDTEDFARRNPVIFFGGAFALGMIAARFLKSSPPSYTDRRFDTSMDQRNLGSLPASQNQPGTTVPPTL